MLDYHKVYMMCFDAGNHSRYFIPSKAKDLVILSVCTTTEKDYRVVYKLPSPFLFGALIRTAPLPDRIWSNVEYVLPRCRIVYGVMLKLDITHPL